jgi:pimeloyl-ACP methyl ester carboxylesterase
MQTKTLRTLIDRSGEAASSTLIVFLPPAMTTIENIVEHGFVAALRARNITADIVLAEITHEQVMQQRVADTLREAVIAPALARGYRQIWIAGISLGAFNALHYAARFADDLAGLCLLAPYPGTGDILREIEQAGGPAAWAARPDHSLRDEREWWHWLWQQSQVDRTAKPIYVGLSADDRFLRGQQLLTQLIPAEHVDMIPGTHDWPAWLGLWELWLDENWLDKSLLSRTGQ